MDLFHSLVTTGFEDRPSAYLKGALGTTGPGVWNLDFSGLHFTPRAQLFGEAPAPAPVVSGHELNELGRAADDMLVPDADLARLVRDAPAENWPSAAGVETAALAALDRGVDPETVAAGAEALGAVDVAEAVRDAVESAEMAGVGDEAEGRELPPDLREAADEMAERKVELDEASARLKAAAAHRRHR